MIVNAREWQQTSHSASLTTAPLIRQAFTCAGLTHGPTIPGISGITARRRLLTESGPTSCPKVVKASRFGINDRSPDPASTAKQFPRTLSRIAGDLPGTTHSIQTHPATFPEAWKETCPET